VEPVLVDFHSDRVPVRRNAPVRPGRTGPGGAGSAPERDSRAGKPGKEFGFRRLHVIAGLGGPRGRTRVSRAGPGQAPGAGAHRLLRRHHPATAGTPRSWRPPTRTNQVFARSASARARPGTPATTPVMSRRSEDRPMAAVDGPAVTGGRAVRHPPAGGAARRGGIRCGELASTYDADRQSSSVSPFAGIL